MIVEWVNEHWILSTLIALAIPFFAHAYLVDKRHPYKPEPKRVKPKQPTTLQGVGFECIPIREKIVTGPFSSTRVTTGFRYFVQGEEVDLHMLRSLNNTEWELRNAK